MNIKKELLKLAKNISRPKVKISPKHWWGWFSPKFWKQKKVMEVLLNDPNSPFQKDRDKMILNSLMFGRGFARDELEKRMRSKDYSGS